MRKNLAYYEAEYEELLETQPDNVASQNETLTKISKINEGIDGWQSILDYIDTMTAQAEAGNLTRQTHLMPSKLMANAMDFDLNKVEDAEANLEVNDAISFSGGGLKVQKHPRTSRPPPSTSCLPPLPGAPGVTAVFSLLINVTVWFDIGLGFSIVTRALASKKQRLPAATFITSTGTRALLGTTTSPPLSLAAMWVQTWVARVKSTTRTQQRMARVPPPPLALS